MLVLGRRRCSRVCIRLEQIWSFIGTTEWSGWGFKENILGVKKWSAQEANTVSDAMVFSTNTVFNPYPSSITNAVAMRFETDSHLTQGIPALSPPTGRTDLSHKGIPSFDMNDAQIKTAAWPREPASIGSDDLGDNWLHSDLKNVAYFYTHRLFQKIVEIGGLR